MFSKESLRKDVSSFVDDVKNWRRLSVNKRQAAALVLGLYVIPIVYILGILCFFWFAPNYQVTHVVIEKVIKTELVKIHGGKSSRLKIETQHGERYTVETPKNVAEEVQFFKEYKNNKQPAPILLVDNAFFSPYGSQNINFEPFVIDFGSIKNDQLGYWFYRISNPLLVPLSVLAFFLVVGLFIVCPVCALISKPTNKGRRKRRKILSPIYNTGVVYAGFCTGLLISEFILFWLSTILVVPVYLLSF